MREWRVVNTKHIRWLALLLAWCAAAALARPLELGEVDFPTSARSPQAQAHFARGVAALHSFWYPKAREEFRAATRIEPRFAMGYWGEAMTHDHPVWGDKPDTAAARAALAKIDDSFSVSERERAYIDAARLLYSDGNKAYAQAMAKLHERYPQDMEAALFYALALLGLGNDKQRLRGGEIALRVFEERPRHPGAAHYVIHAYDDPQHAPIALPAARRYASIAPDAPHALHMPAHIFLQLGMWREAAESNERAWAASEKRDLHSLHWLGYIYLQQGRYGEAERLLDAMREVKRNDPYATYTAALIAATYLIETEQWQRADELLGKGNTVAQSPAIFARGLAAAMTGSPQAQEAIETLRSLKPLPGAEKAPYVADIIAAARIQADLVAAAAAAEDKRYPEALERVREAIAAAERTPTPPGPPVLVKPPRELRAEILLQAGRPEAAAQNYAVVLARHKDRARALLGAARAAAAEGRPEEASDLYARLARQWQRADSGLPELAEARQERTGAAAAGSSRRE